MKPYTYKTYRCEWVVEVFEIDDQGFSRRNGEIYYRKSFSNRHDALAELEIIAPKNPHHLRRVWENAPNSYHNAHIKYEEVLVNEEIRYE